MNKNKRNLYLIYPGMTPSYSMFVSYTLEGRMAAETEQDTVKEAREGWIIRSIRMVQKLIRKPAKAGASA